MSRSVTVKTWMLTALFASPLPASAQLLRADDSTLPQVDTFHMQANGQSVGTQVMTLQPTGEGGYVMRETTSWAGGNQSTEVQMDDSFHVLSVTQEGRAGDQNTEIDIRYADGRVSGTARVGGEAGPVDVTVDADVPENVVDDNAFLGLIPLLPWRADAEFELPVFSAGRNQLVVHRLRVTGTEKIRVPAGTAETYRVEVTGMRPLVLYVSRRTSRLVRLEVAGTPMEMVRGGPPLS